MCPRDRHVRQEEVGERPANKKAPSKCRDKKSSSILVGRQHQHTAHKRRQGEVSNERVGEGHARTIGERKVKKRFERKTWVRRRTNMLKKGASRGGS